MIDNNILSCVVLTKSGKYHGFIEIFDILKYVVELYGDLPEDQIPSASLVQEKVKKIEKKFVKQIGRANSQKTKLIFVVAILL
jgi:hypothetical protein